MKGCPPTVYFVGVFAVIDLVKRLLDPKVQLFIVGLLTVFAGVCEYLLASDFVQGYPEVLGVIAAVSAVVVGALRVAKTIFLTKKSAKKGR